MNEIPCKHCWTKTKNVETRRCDACWEIERRIRMEPDRAASIIAGDPALLASLLKRIGKSMEMEPWAMDATKE